MLAQLNKMQLKVNQTRTQEDQVDFPFASLLDHPAPWLWKASGHLSFRRKGMIKWFSIKNNLPKVMAFMVTWVTMRGDPMALTTFWPHCSTNSTKPRNVREQFDPKVFKNNHFTKYIFLYCFRHQTSANDKGDTKACGQWHSMYDLHGSIPTERGSGKTQLRPYLPQELHCSMARKE